MIKTFLTIGIIFTVCHNVLATNVNDESALVHADMPWEMTDIITKDDSTLSWSVSNSDLWSFNKDVFPDGHNANGIEGIPALYGYVYPGENLGKLIGRIGDSGRMFPMGISGEISIERGEGGNYLYLTINDEISQVYGRGFKDNEGELFVKITQNPRLTFNIQLIYYERCPGFKYALSNLEDTMIEEGIKDAINIIKLSNLQEAKNLKVIGSPTIRINNKDIDPSFQKSANLSFPSNGFPSNGLQCRSYSSEGKTMGWPSKELIRDALRKAKKEIESQQNKDY